MNLLSILQFLAGCIASMSAIGIGWYLRGEIEHRRIRRIISELGRKAVQSNLEYLHRGEQAGMQQGLALVSSLNRRAQGAGRS